MTNAASAIVIAMRRIIPTCCDMASSSGQGDNFQRYLAEGGNIFRNDFGEWINFHEPDEQSSFCQ